MSEISQSKLRFGPLNTLAPYFMKMHITNSVQALIFNNPDAACYKGVVCRVLKIRPLQQGHLNSKIGAFSLDKEYIIHETSGSLGLKSIEELMCFHVTNAIGDPLSPIAFGLMVEIDTEAASTQHTTLPRKQATIHVSGIVTVDGIIHITRYSENIANKLHHPVHSKDKSREYFRRETSTSKMNYVNYIPTHHVHK